MMSYLRKIRYMFHRDEEGVAMTEFVIFLPAWIVTFLGVFALGRLGLDTTKVQLTAQQQLWDRVIPITNSDADLYMTPRSSLVEWGPHLAGLAGDSDNDQQVQDGVESAIMIAGQGGFGHWGESYGRVKPFQLIGSIADFAQVDDLTFQGGTDILNDRTYPKMLLDDTAIQTAPSGGLDGVLSLVLGISGIMPALGAGVRYGTVFGEVNDHPIKIAGGQTVAASAHYDILVAPSARRGDATLFTDLLAYALTQTNETYRNLFFFGRNDYGGSGGSHPDYNPTGDIQDQIDDKKDEAEEDREEACEAFSGEARCNTCLAQEYNTPAACDAALGPEPED